MVRQTICRTWGFHSRNSKTLWRRQLRQSQCQRQADLVKDGSQFGTFGLKLPRSEGLVKCVLAHHGITHMAQHGIPSNPNTYIILYLTICIYVYYTSSSLSLSMCVYIYIYTSRQTGACCPLLELGTEHRCVSNYAVCCITPVPRCMTKPGAEASVICLKTLES